MSSFPSIILLHGAPAAGKYTIAKELVALDTSLRLFHNHLVVDMLLSLFPFGSRNFIKHRERIWVELMEEAIKDQEKVVFTFNPESTVSTEFPSKLIEAVEKAGGQILFIEVGCQEEIIEKRMEETSRRTYNKLNSTTFYKELKEKGSFDYPPLSIDFSVNSSFNSPSQSAALIYEYVKERIYK